MRERSRGFTAHDYDICKHIYGIQKYNAKFNSLDEISLKSEYLTLIAK